MKKKFIINVSIFILLLLTTVAFTACSKKDAEPKNYPVEGIWHAHATWHRDNPYNYGGDNYTLDLYYDFHSDGTFKYKALLILNDNIEITNTDWCIANITWTVEGNVIKFSNGKKQYVIVDDQFDDEFPNPRMTVHYKKVNSDG